MRNKIIETEIDIKNFKFPNVGVGEYENKNVNIKNTLPGQKVLVKMAKKRRAYIGKVLDFIKRADYEIEPLCADFLNCGGCTFQNIEYEKELEIKKNMVKDILKENNIEFDFEIVPSPKTSGYRNKMEFSFGDSGLGSELELGMRKMNSFYEVVTSKNCNIIDNDFKLILLETLDFFKNSDDSFYHKKNHEGSLRHLVLRKGEFTGEIFINLVSTSALKTDPWLFAECIKNLNTQQKIVSISHSVNDSVSDIVQAEKFTLLYGRDYFFEEINNLKFKIFPFSFFQTNSSGAEKLYNTVCEFAGDLAGKTVFDLYCGTGTIAQIISKNAKKVYGIEIVNEAVEAAKANADLNNIKNCEFIAGDVLKKIDELSIKPDLIILDPPRDGVHPKAIEKIISFNAKEILYISCKPSSLARDLNIFLENHYKIEKIICHDMFSKTYHVETIVLMQRVEMA